MIPIELQIDGNIGFSWGKVTQKVIEVVLVKDTHREKEPLNKSPAPTKSTNMDIWVVLKLKQKLQKNKVVTGKTPFFMIGPFCTHCSICLDIGF